MLTAKGRPPLLDRVVALTEPKTAESLVREYLELPHMPVAAVTPVGVRPKGAAGGLVTYSIELADGTMTFVSARVATKRRLLAGWERLQSERSKWRGDLAAGAIVNDGQVLLTAFPLDRRLPWLRPYTEAEKAKHLLLDSGVVDSDTRVYKSRSSVTLASYRAERRAVLRWDFNCKLASAERRPASLYVRLHSDPSPALRSNVALQAALAGGLPVPTPLMVNTGRGIAVEGAVGGGFARSGLTGAADARLLGALVAALHRLPAPAGLPISRVDHRLRQATRAVRGLLDIEPELGAGARDRLARVARDVPQLAPDAPRLLHGDLHGGQLVVGSAGGFLVDFDRSCGGHPAQDIGSFLAHLVLERPNRSGKEFDSFIDGYSSRAPRLSDAVLHHHVAIELLCLADAPFRRLVPEWRDVTIRLLHHVDRHLAQLDCQ